MKLVNTYAHILILSLLIGLNTTQAQVWSLQQCIDTAQANNKNLQMSRNNITIGEQKQKEVKANLIPKVTANADYKYFTNLPYQLMPLSTFNPMAPEGQFKEAQFGVPHNVNANLQLMMPLYNSQVYGAIKTTKIAEEFSELQYRKSEEQLFFEISNLYYNAQILSTQLSFIDSNLVNINKLLTNMKLLREQLMITGTDVSKTQLKAEQLVTQKSLANSKYEQVLNALKFSMGIALNQNIQIETNIQYHNSTDYTSLSTIDIQLTKTQNKLLSSELSTLKNSRLPSLSLFGNFGYSGFGYDRQPNEFFKTYPIGFAGLQFSYPLFNGTVTYRKIKQKKLELQNSELKMSLITEQNTMQIENANLQRMTTQKSVEMTMQQIKLAQTIYDQTFIQQKQGTATLTDALMADNALREVQQSHLNAIIDYLKADLELKKLTGNISSPK